ncbi:DUF1885 family protein [Paenibacillus sacheonensis]|uniref:DUF1885 family protein n=1 Tax=Paenibacillus sacheonensis TaxID=742054 RepID=A0A7X5C238_9BACL|nr:DUF1885 family protein [Paenibacillus sacheonensis]MBM7564328.1 hypothetical protein [Paenibacillus sacheonensis]NBC73442.1 DUF1885 family protein [Paenibacillus sacheonensis]
MSQSAYIKFVQGSAVEALSLSEVKERLGRYKEQTSLTGQQLDWDYAEAAFPYTVEVKAGEEDRWFYLKGTTPQYNYILFGVGSETEGEKTVSHIQVVLPDTATHGDKSKANELCKYMAKQLLAELKMFNGRTIYYNPRK